MCVCTCECVSACVCARVSVSVCVCAYLDADNPNEIKSDVILFQDTTYRSREHNIFLREKETE